VPINFSEGSSERNDISHLLVSSDTYFTWPSRGRSAGYEGQTADEIRAVTGFALDVIRARIVPLSQVKPELKVTQ
jgi:hypothetical protein